MSLSICTWPQVARHLVQDTVCCPMSSSLSSLPTKSPLFTTNLMAGVGELYSRVTVAGDSEEYSPPPARTVGLVTSWLAAAHTKGRVQKFLLNT